MDRVYSFPLCFIFKSDAISWPLVLSIFKRSKVQLVRVLAQLQMNATIRILSPGVVARLAVVLFVCTIFFVDVPS